MEQRTIFFIILAIVFVMLIIFMTTDIKDRITDIGRLFGTDRSEIENAITSMPFKNLDKGRYYSKNLDSMFLA